jgi:hypothetical protein
MTVITARRLRSYSAAGSIGIKLRRAQRLQDEIQRLEAQLSPLRASLLEHMHRQGLDRIELGQFRATRKVRHNWSYSGHADAVALRLRQLQLDEQAEGVATDRPTSYVAFSVKP